MEFIVYEDGKPYCKVTGNEARERAEAIVSNMKQINPNNEYRFSEVTDA